MHFSLCVVEIWIEVDGKSYKTYAEIGNSNTSEINLIGRYKLFDYFTITIELAKKNIQIFGGSE